MSADDEKFYLRNDSIDLINDESIVNLFKMDSPSEEPIEIDSEPIREAPKMQSSVNPSGPIYDTSLVDESGQLALEMVQASKSYGFGGSSKLLLDNFNLKCPAKKIYILYGARYSGKTSCLKAILRLTRLDLGIIEYFGSIMPPKSLNIGYMPQESGLYELLTVRETFEYFGRLNKVEKTQVQEKIHEAMYLFGLAQPNLYIRHLHENQVKGLSFLLSILNNPNLLILDEPTSCLDPLIRHKIWIKIKWVRRTLGTTVLLTTSDAQECHDAEIVGYLRNGRMIFEASPRFLLETYGVTAMIKVFYCAAVGQGDRFANRHAMEEERRKSKSLYMTQSGEFIPDTNLSLKEIKIDPLRRVSEIFEQEKYPKVKERFIKDSLFPPFAGFWERFYFLMSHFMLSTWRNRLLLFYLYFVVPTFFFVIFYYGVGQEIQNFVLGIYKETGCDSLSGSKHCEFYQNFLRHAPDHFAEIKIYESREEALKSLESGDIDGLAMSEEEFPLSNTTSSFFDIPGMEILISDTSEIVKDQIYRTASKMAAEFNESDDPSSRSSISQYLEQIHSVKEPRKTEFESDYLLWGFATVFFFFSGAIKTSHAIMDQKRVYLLHRMMVLGISYLDLQFVVCVSVLIVTAIQNVYCIALIFLLSDQDLLWSTLGIAWTLAMLQSIAGMAFGLALAMIHRTWIMLMVSLCIFSSVAFLVCGIIWTFYALPSALKLLAYYFPHTFVARAFRLIMLSKKGELQFGRTWMGFIMPIGWSIQIYIVFFIFYNFLGE